VSHVAASWSRAAHRTPIVRTCFFCGKGPFSMPRSGGRSAPTFRKFQRGAVTWREKRAHVFSKVRTHQHASWQPSSIDCPLYPSLFYLFTFHPNATRLAQVRGCCEDCARNKKNTVRNRDTSLERTEKSLGLYIVAWGTDNSKQKT
jgi:hypothetical protein